MYKPLEKLKQLAKKAGYTDFSPDSLYARCGLPAMYWCPICEENKEMDICNGGHFSLLNGEPVKLKLDTEYHEECS